MSHPDDTVQRVQRSLPPRGPCDARLDGIRFERLPLPYREVYRLATDRWSRLSSGREVRRLIRDLHVIRRVLPNHLIDWERPDGHPHSLVVVTLADSRAVGFESRTREWRRRVDDLALDTCRPHVFNRPRTKHVLESRWRRRSR